MHMAVDQAGHQRPLAAVDDGGRCQLDRFGRDFPDGVTFDDHFAAADQFAGLRIEHFEILEMVDIHGPALDRLRLD